MQLYSIIHLESSTYFSFHITFIIFTTITHRDDKDMARGWELRKGEYLLTVFLRGGIEGLDGET